MNVSNLFKTPEEYLYTNKALLYLFIPLLVEYALAFFVGFADSIMVASLGEAAISGVSLVDFLVQLLIFSFSALATGGAVVAGQYLGDKQIDKAQDSATQLVWFSTILSTVLMIAVILLRQVLIGVLFGQIEADVWANADAYLYIIALSIPFIACKTATYAPIATEGLPFSTAHTVARLKLALSATKSAEISRLKRASLICSPIILSISSLSGIIMIGFLPISIIFLNVLLYYTLFLLLCQYL